MAAAMLYLFLSILIIGGNYLFELCTKRNWKKAGERTHLMGCALLILFFVVLTLAYGMIAIHDIPYNIAKKRNHPHQDAIHTGGWVSLFTLHAIWPFLWMWATSYHPVHGYRGERPAEQAGPSPAATPQLAELERRLAAIENASKAEKESNPGKEG